MRIAMNMERTVNPMQLHIPQEKGVPIQPGMIGLFFEDINYAADGGLYAEMIENRSFEFVDCFGDAGDYYAIHDCGYGWHPTTACGEGRMAYVMGSPVNRSNPHYLRFTATQAGQGFCNQAYSGIHLEKGMTYNVSFYARMARYQGDLTVSVEKEQQVFARGSVACVHAPEKTWQKWIRYELTLEAKETVSGARFVIALDQPGVVEFDFISMMPEIGRAHV